MYMHSHKRSVHPIEVFDAHSAAHVIRLVIWLHTSAIIIIYHQEYDSTS